VVFVVRLAELLPTCHRIYLHHVICVLHQIAAHAHTNNMTAHNLSVCIAQNLLWPPQRTGAAEMLVDVSRVSQICARLIDSAADVFGPRCLELFEDTSSPVQVRLVSVSTDDDHSVTSDNTGQLLYSSLCYFTNLKKILFIIIIILFIYIIYYIFILFIIYYYFF